MSAGGRRRVVVATVRSISAVLLGFGLVWGLWEIVAALREAPHASGAVAKEFQMRPPELITTRDGVLDQAWLIRTLALRKNTSLMELDLGQIRQRVLADQQVLTANVSRSFPDRLIVQITERMPVARVMAELAGTRQTLLVAMDGAVFTGTNYDPDTIASLPWLDGIALARKANVFQPIAGIEPVSELLVKAQLETERLYQEWDVVSLARLQSDREIIVRTREPHVMTIVFSVEAKDAFMRQQGFFRQLARLDYLWDNLTRHPFASAKVDLSLGAQVPVMVTEARDERGAVQIKAGAGNSFSINSPAQSRNKREL
jgi:hypothetical protein